LNINNLDTLDNHPSATQALKALLKSLGSPQTSSENETLTLLAHAYMEMGQQFPSPELKAALDGLYSQAQAIADAIQHGSLALANEFTNLAVEVEGFTSPILMATAQEKHAAARSKTFHQIERESTPLLRRAHQLRFLALEAATKRIHAALKKLTRK
jgi:hypothetical protein